MPVLHASLGLIVGLCAGLLLAAWLRRRAARDPIRKHPWGMGEDDPYRLHDSVLTKSEDTWYRALDQALPPGHLILSKVRLADLFQVTYAARDRGIAKSRLNGKTLHFVVCDAAFRPKLGIILQPETPDRSEILTWEWLSRICEKAEFPLLLLPAVMEPEAIAARIRAQLGTLSVAA